MPPTPTWNVVGHRVGDRDLAGAGRIAALAQREHRRAVGAVRVLGPESTGLDRARDRHACRWPITSIVPNQSRDGGDGGVEPARVGLVELDAVVGRAERGVAVDGARLYAAATPKVGRGDRDA